MKSLLLPDVGERLVHDVGNKGLVRAFSGTDRKQRQGFIVGVDRRYLQRLNEHGIALFTSVTVLLDRYCLVLEHNIL